MTRCWLVHYRFQINKLDKSTIPPVYLQLSTTLYRPSWAAVHNTFFLSAFSLPLYIFFRWSRSCSKQIAAHVGSFNTKNFCSEGQKNLVNWENKENLSNYQLLKRKPSVCSTSLHFSKLITVVQIFFRVTSVLQWFEWNFGAENFRGRRPGTSALRMLLRLTAVKSWRGFLWMSLHLLTTELQNNCACVTYDPVGARRRENLDLSNTFLLKDQS